ncbi:hypothetical protein [Nocardia paucivorans]|uniref:hypothetical protein n=1 Tax=Nocardia paucivorans TaxID=114259 RepID=UPI0012FA0905|nr:hypothetical protein [Nocardia paucivorans]
MSRPELHRNVVCKSPALVERQLGGGSTCRISGELDGFFGEDGTFDAATDTTESTTDRTIHGGRGDFAHVFSIGQRHEAADDPPDKRPARRAAQHEPDHTCAGHTCDGDDRVLEKIPEKTHGSPTGRSVDTGHHYPPAIRTVGEHRRSATPAIAYRQPTMRVTSFLT